MSTKRVSELFDEYIKVSESFIKEIEYFNIVNNHQGSKILNQMAEEILLEVHTKDQVEKDLKYCLEISKKIYKEIESKDSIVDSKSIRELQTHTAEIVLNLRKALLDPIEDLINDPVKIEWMKESGKLVLAIWEKYPDTSLATGLMMQKEIKNWMSKSIWK